jgi:hypothetical protein
MEVKGVAWGSTVIERYVTLTCPEFFFHFLSRSTASLFGTENKLK